MSRILTPVDLQDALPSDLASSYNRSALQRERILAALASAGAAGLLGSELAQRCQVPSVTKRISELRRAGHQIDSEADHLTGPGGVSACVRYVLASRTQAQGDLFGDAAKAGRA